MINIIVINCDDKLVEYEWTSKEIFLHDMIYNKGNTPMPDDSIIELNTENQFYDEEFLKEHGICTVRDLFNDIFVVCYESIRQ